MDHGSYSDDYLRDLLRKVRVIAMVGVSTDWNKPSQFVMKYLQKRGYRVIPINPKAAGTTILNETVQPSLDAVSGPVDMVDVFRNSEAALEITADAIRLKERFDLKAVWMQIGVSNPPAAAAAEAAGLAVVMNRCPKIEHSRLIGELSWGGFNSGIISSKRRAKGP